MENTGYILLSREAALRRQMTAVANNIANMNTHGFKAERMLFVEHLVRSRDDRGLLGDKHAFVRDVASYRVQEEGPLLETGNPLDLTIHGGGYFVIDTDAGPRYTRNGHFRLDETGQLVTQSGAPVMSDDNQPILFAPDDTDIRISRDGSISAESGELGRLRIVEFESDYKLQREAGAMYTSADDPQDAESPRVIQGMIEGSNVQPILEMTRMIEVHRAYQSAQRFVQKEDTRIKSLADTLLGQS